MTRCSWSIELPKGFEEWLKDRLYKWLLKMVDEYEAKMQLRSKPHHLSWEHQDSMMVVGNRAVLEVNLENDTRQALILQFGRKWWQLSWYYPNLDWMAQFVTRNPNASYDWADLETQRSARAVWYAIRTNWIKPRKIYTKTLASNQQRLIKKFIQWFSS